MTKKSEPTPLSDFVEEDFQAWSKHSGNFQYRSLFNKMEIALRQELDAGPAASAPEKSGWYVHRPIYNLYGMGINAVKFYYDAETMHDRMINHDIVPPGHFWCEWIEGDHLSIDYQQYSDGSWRTRSVWQGEHHSDDNLTKFKTWKRLSEEYGPTFESTGLMDIFGNDPYVPYCNIEMRGDYIIEVHLRLGNDPFDEYPVGSEITPVWNGDVAPQGAWKPNLHEDLEKYSANGYLSDVRRGHVVNQPQ